MRSTARPTRPLADALVELHAGLSARPTPQQVARILVDATFDRQLPAAARVSLRDLARADQAGTSMATQFATHPGLVRAYAAAAAAVGAVTTAMGADPLGPADPCDPASLGEWLVDAYDLLGLDLGSVRPARATVRRQATTRSVTYTTTFTPYADWDDLDDLASDGVDDEDEDERCTVVRNADGSVTTSCTMELRQLHRARGPRGDTGGHVDVRGRRPAAVRRAQMPGVSVRAYRRAVRAAAHLDQRTRVLAAQRHREAAIRYGKSRLASSITLDDFTASPATGAFVAYYTARLGMRAIFTNGQQGRPMDELAQALFDHARAQDDYRPDVVAKVLGRAGVLAACTPEQLEDLAAQTWDLLTASACALADAADPHRPTMVVRAGDDSTTWNTASRAFNQARTGWLALITATGRQAMLDTLLPGKVPALIAADVAAWHTEVHVDTTIAKSLPAPWDVVLGRATCTRAMVEAACHAAGVDPAATGWTSPYQQDGLAETAAAPDLVHGVVVPDPQLASALKAAGVLSGTSVHLDDICAQ